MASSVDLDGIAKCQSILDEIDALSTEIAALKQSAARLMQAEVELTSARKSLISELERMDLVSSGNMGWEARTVAFLTKLYKRAKHS